MDRTTTRNTESAPAIRRSRRAFGALVIGAGVTLLAGSQLRGVQAGCDAIQIGDCNDISRVIATEARRIKDVSGQVRDEWAAGNGHIIIAPTKAQLKELERGDVTLERIQELGLDAKYLKTRTNGEVHTVHVASIDSQGKPNWVFGENFVAAQGCPEFSRRIRFCDLDLDAPGHLYWRFKIDRDPHGGLLLKPDKPFVSAVNCSPLRIAFFSDLTESGIAILPTPTITATLEPTATPTSGPKPAPAQIPTGRIDVPAEQRSALIVIGTPKAGSRIDTRHIASLFDFGDLRAVA